MPLTGGHMELTKEQLANKEYILGLSSRLRVQIPDISSLLDLSRPEINETIMNLKSVVGDTPKFELSTAIIDALKARNLQKLNARITEIDDTIYNRNRSLEDYYRRIRELLASNKQQIKAKELLIAQRDTNELNFPIVDEIKKIVSLGFLGNPSLKAEDNSVQFTTMNDVIITQGNIFVNFGRYKVIFSLFDGWAKVFPHERNIMYNGFYHPFVSSSGTICFGEQTDIAHDYIKNGEVLEYSKLLESLLTTFDENSNPYCQLRSFDKEYKLKNPTAKVVDFCKICAQRLAFCVCTKCTNCQAKFVDGKQQCDCVRCSSCGQINHADQDCECQL